MLVSCCNTGRHYRWDFDRYLRQETSSRIPPYKATSGFGKYQKVPWKECYYSDRGNQKLGFFIFIYLEKTICGEINRCF